MTVYVSPRSVQRMNSMKHYELPTSLNRYRKETENPDFLYIYCHPLVVFTITFCNAIWVHNFRKFKKF